MSSPSPLEGYIEHVLRTGTVQPHWSVPAPHHLRRFSREELERALADPRVLLRDSSLTDEARAVRLLGFALWLESATAAHLPADLRSRAARFRFLVWSVLLRLDPAQARPVWPTRVDWTPAATPPGQEDYLTLSPTFVGVAARLAREEWLSHLDAWEDDLWLAVRHADDPRALESDLRWLTTTWPRSPEWTPPGPPAPLDLDPPAVGRTAPTKGSPPPAGHDRLVAALNERHWLLRGSPLAAAAAWRPGRTYHQLLPVAFLLPSLAVVALYVAGLVGIARWVALADCVVVVLGAAVLPVPVSGLAVLRVPAATVIGQAVLLSLTPRWWLSSWGWTVGAGLLVLAFGYLALEARMHGSAARLAYGRGALLWSAGTLNAFMISMVSLAFVAPAVAEDGGCLDHWWQQAPWVARDLQPGCHALTSGTAPASAEVLVLMTGWSLAFGLAAQILWDDRPVTAPLGRTRRGRGA